MAAGAKVVQRAHTGLWGVWGWRFGVVGNFGGLLWGGIWFLCQEPLVTGVPDMAPIFLTGGAVFGFCGCNL